MGQLKTEVRLPTATPSIILIEISIMKSWKNFVEQITEQIFSVNKWLPFLLIPLEI